MAGVSGPGTPWRLHAVVPRSTANGPGVRYVVWSQGCALACPGCFNPTRVRTALRDADLLVQALAEVGFRTVEAHDTPQTLHGYRGDARPERAEVVIRRAHIGGASNDIGFRLGADGTFEAVISEYDRSRYNEPWLANVARAYGHAAALRYAEDNGYEVDFDELEANGRRRLVLRRYT